MRLAMVSCAPSFFSKKPPSTLMFWRSTPENYEPLKRQKRLFGRRSPSAATNTRKLVPGTIFVWPTGELELRARYHGKPQRRNVRPPVLSQACHSAPPAARHPERRALYSSLQRWCGCSNRGRDEPWNDLKETWLSEQLHNSSKWAGRVA